MDDFEMSDHEVVAESPVKRVRSIFAGPASPGSPGSPRGARRNLNLVAAGSGSMGLNARLRAQSASQPHRVQISASDFDELDPDNDGPISLTIQPSPPKPAPTPRYSSTRASSSSQRSASQSSRVTRSATDHDEFAFDDDGDDDDVGEVAKKGKERSSTTKKRKRRDDSSGDASAKRSRAGQPRTALGVLQQKMGTNLVRYNLGRRGRGPGWRGNGGSGGTRQRGTLEIATQQPSSDADLFSLLPDLLDLSNVPDVSSSMTDATAAAAPVSDTALLDALELLVGSREFRPGQETVIRRLLDGQSAFLLSTTGGGKSLCYQLPTLLRKRGITTGRRPLTLVVSPLVALMEDQMSNLPTALEGACLHSLQPAAVRAQTLEALCAGSLDVLFVSPEKLTGPLFSRLIAERRMPRVALLCIDEIHCASEWSHNFRPAYLRLARVVREDLKPATILGLSATVTIDCQRSLLDLFGLEESCVVRARTLPSNIHLSVVRETDKMRELLALLKSPAFSGLRSILVYCMRQGDADDVAEFLRSRGEDASSYHAGKSRDHRSALQARFLQGEVRVLVATTAFGMGINKHDVRAVVHYALPRSVEALVQEAGRAGRDGGDAVCRIFYDPDDVDAIRSQAYSGAIGRDSIEEFLKAIADAAVASKDPSAADAVALPSASAAGKRGEFDMDSDDDDELAKRPARANVAASRDVFVPIAATLRDADVARETAETLLAYLEATPGSGVRVLPPAMRTAVVTVYRPDVLAGLTGDERPAIVDYLMTRRTSAHSRKNTNSGVRVRSVASGSAWNTTKNIYRVDIFRAAAAIGAAESSGAEAVLAQLATLRFRRILQFELIDECFVLRLPSGDAARKRLANATDADALMERVAQAQQAATLKLRAIAALVTQAADRKIPAGEHDSAFADAIARYFDSETAAATAAAMSKGGSSSDSGSTLSIRDKVVLAADVRVFIATCGIDREEINAVAIARIMHAMASPRFPSSTWAQSPFWGRHTATDFADVVKIAERLLAT